MSVDMRKYDLALQQVVTAKAAWSKHARSLTWEEKVAAIEHMQERGTELKKCASGKLFAKKGT